MGILLHGGPPSDSSFRLDEGRKEEYITYGVSEEEAETCRSATTEVRCVYEPKPCKVHYPASLRVVFKGPTGARNQTYSSLQEACPCSAKDNTVTIKTM